MQVGHRHLGGRDQEVIVALELEQVLLELRQLPGADQRRAVDHEGRQHLGVAMVRGVQVEHEGDQSPLEPRRGSPVDGETRPGDLGGALEIEDAQRRSEVPVGLGLEGKPPRLADLPLDPVRGLVPSARHRLVRQVGEAKLDRGERRLELPQPALEPVDARLELAHRRHLRAGVAAFGLDGSDRLGGLVAPALELLDLGDSGAALGVEAQPLLERCELGAAGRERCAHARGVLAQPLSIQHGAAVYRRR